jgi:hypothetical protein
LVKDFDPGEQPIEIIDGKTLRRTADVEAVIGGTQMIGAKTGFSTRLIYLDAWTIFWRELFAA